MVASSIYTSIRNNAGLTQDEMAKKLFVTRQAVSRWETGETTPNIETLKLISQEFKISINTLVGQEEPPICQSCSMPLLEIDDFGTTVDDGITTEYCSHCYAKGKFTHDRTIEEMVEANLRFLDEYNKQQGTSLSLEEARPVLKAHLSTLARWQRKESSANILE